MINIITEIIGYSAAVVGTSLMLPQVIKSWRTKKVKDISFFMLVLYFINCTLWAAYGFLISSIPIIACNLIALIISIIQILIKLRYN